MVLNKLFRRKKTIKCPHCKEKQELNVGTYQICCKCGKYVYDNRF